MGSAWKTQPTQRWLQAEWAEPGLFSALDLATSAPSSSPPVFLVPQ